MSDNPSNDFMNAAANLSGSFEDTPQVPDKFGELESGKFFEALKEATNGAFGTFEEMNKGLGQLAKVQEYENQLQQLQSQVNQDPFADPLIKTLNEYASKGASTDELYNFLKIQSDLSNLDNLGEIDKIRMQMRMENPSLNNQDIDALLQDELGSLNIDDFSEAEKAKLKSKAFKAQQFLTEKRDSAIPASFTNAQQQQRRFETLSKAWDTGLSGMFKTWSPSFDVTLPSAKEGEAPLSIGYEVDDATRQQVKNLTVQYAAQQGITEFTPKTVKEVLEPYARQVLILQKFPEILAHAVHNAKTGTQQEINRNLHNLPTNTPPSTNGGGGNNGGMTDEFIAARNKIFGT